MTTTANWAKDFYNSVKNKTITNLNTVPQTTTKQQYIIKLDGKRFNNKLFNTFEDARKYVRKVITKRVGRYFDSYSQFGFSIVMR